MTLMSTRRGLDRDLGWGWEHGADSGAVTGLK